MWQGRMRPAHQIALALTLGADKPPGRDTCHSCSLRACCNPSHLRFDSRRSNIMDAVRAGTWTSGHELLTPDQVVRLREEYAEGRRQERLAEKYGVSRATVGMIVRGKRWPQVGGPIQVERKYNRGW